MLELPSLGQPWCALQSAASHCVCEGVFRVATHVCRTCVQKLGGCAWPYTLQKSTALQLTPRWSRYQEMHKRRWIALAACDTETNTRTLTGTLGECLVGGAGSATKRHLSRPVHAL